MKWVIRNAHTLDYFVHFGKCGEPVFSTRKKDAKWFDGVRERDNAIYLIEKLGYPARYESNVADTDEPEEDARSRKRR